MSLNRYFWGSFRSVEDGEFTAFRPFLFGDTKYEGGETFDKSSATRRQIETLFLARKIKPVTGDAEKSDIEIPISGDRTATIEEGGAGWLNVINGDGKKVGKSTRDQAEAESIKNAYLAGEIDAE